MSTIQHPITIDRPPRIQPELPFDEITIPDPPDKNAQGWVRLIQAGLPIIMIFGYIMIAAFGGRARSPIFMIPMAMSVLASVAFSVYMYFQEKRQRALMEQKYRSHLATLHEDLNRYHEQQRRFYVHNYPNDTAVIDITDATVAEARRNQSSLRSDARLWERRVGDEDFGFIRLGMGTLPSTVQYVAGELDPLNDDPLVRAAHKLQTDSQFVDEIPVVISVRPQSEDAVDDRESLTIGAITPATHTLGVAGKAEDVDPLMQSMLLQFATMHAPTDAQIYLLSERRSAWSMLLDLPHLYTTPTDPNYHFVERQNATAVEPTENSHEDFLDDIRRALVQRKLQLENQDREEGSQSGAETNFTFFLVIIDLIDVWPGEDSPLQSIESDAAVSIILDEGARLGASVIFVAPDRSKIPSKCQAIVETSKNLPPTNRKARPNRYFRYAETGVNTTRYVGLTDVVLASGKQQTVAKQLAMCQIRQSFGAEIPSYVPLLDLMGHGSLPEMQRRLPELWHGSTVNTNANWLEVALGRTAGSKIRKLHFSASRDGIHGMIAGSTGSGKSELLISLIAGLAVQYDPSMLNFVLVDFKGGGAFEPYRDLPHCVDVVTNLDDDGVTRMFTAIQSELQRRQALNTSTNTKDIVEYHEKGYHQVGADGSAGRAYPFLLIIIDEFAEMIAERPEFRAELESIARVGRAQGVSLILAAQRPTGVTDQMRSNMKFRICLRVETPAESRELLRRSDAAFLPSGLPGRGYLQIGNGEPELIQVAYAGEPYVDPAPVRWPDRRQDEQLYSAREMTELYRVMIELIANMAARLNRPDQHAPWPDPLPPQLSLQDILIAEDENSVNENDKQNIVTSSIYLAQEDRITFGEPWNSVLTLSPSLTAWMNSEYGWIDHPDWFQYAIRPVVGLIDDPYAAKQVPMVIDLPRGHVVIFGASGWGKTTFVRTMVISLTANHPPSHLHVYLLDLGGRNLSKLAELPHVGVVITPDEEGYVEKVTLLFQELEETIAQRTMLLSTEGIPSIYDYNLLHPESPEPIIVVGIDDFIEFQETFKTGPDEESTFSRFVELARQAKPYGIHIVISATDVSALSSHVLGLFSERLTLKLTESADYRAAIGGRVNDLPDVPGRGYVKQAHQVVTFQVAAAFDTRGEAARTEAQTLGEYVDIINQYIGDNQITYRHPRSIEALPQGLLYRRLIAKQWELPADESFFGQWRASASHSWQESLKPANADWPVLSLGISTGDRVRKLALEAKKDGVHGMIAGGTGSGKSELLMTMIVDLALNYSPEIVNFVLVDYKGGGAFAPFAALPHCVDIITNLNTADVQRMFVAIGAEMRRRQALNTDTRTKDIVEYRANGHHLDRPYPHLFVIIDEYAEMISSNPEFKEQLESITRVGRAQGVHLLLASQRPIGITDQMRANIKFRICLRVEEVETSREMLRRPEAAYLPNGIPGRGYLQIGNDNIELVQVAYTGEAYQSLDNDAEDSNLDTEFDDAKFYDRTVFLAQDLAQNRQQKAPWPHSLAREIILQDKRDAKYWDPDDIAQVMLDMQSELALNPFVRDWQNGAGQWRRIDWTQARLSGIAGLVDDPANARQLPLSINISNGHVVLFGASGRGKTTFLRTLITSLAVTYSPDDLHVHVLDLGGRQLDMLSALPHVGTLIMPDERGYEERVQQLLKELEDIIEHRRQHFGDQGVFNLFEYNQSNPQDTLPAMLIAIDNFGEFVENFSDQTQTDDEESIWNLFISLLRQGKAYGIHVVITAPRMNILSSSLYSLFTERLTLRLSDSDAYRAIVGHDVPPIDEIAGRGYMNIKRSALEFQVAWIRLSSNDENGNPRWLNESQSIRLLGGLMSEYGADQWSKRRPFRIEALPKSSSYRQVLMTHFGLQHETSFTTQLGVTMRRRWDETTRPENADWLEFILGISSGNRHRALHMSAKTDGVHGLVAGGTGSGKSELLMTMIVGLVANYSPEILNFVLVDYKGGGAFRPFEGLPHCVDLVTNLDATAVDRMFTSINAEIHRRQLLNAETETKDIVDYRRKGYHITREPYPHLVIIIDEYAEMIDDNPDYKSQLESITRVGRAQGINLILASQRPKGVSDQMRANIKFRICLRVEELDTSREMLRRPDAAYLPSLPGRGYLQVGNDNIELIQVSYTGEQQLDDRPTAVLWSDRPADSRQDDPDEASEPLFDMVTAMARELHAGESVKQPWPKFLPRFVSLQAPVFDSQKLSSYSLADDVVDWSNGESSSLWSDLDWRKAMTPSVGLVDNPRRAEQVPLTVDLRSGHLLILGDSGSGKSTFLRTTILDLCASHSPVELHIYVLDLGGRTFRSLEGLPHIGSVIYADEEKYEERLERLLAKLNDESRSRQKQLSDDGAGNVYEYNNRRPEQAIPAILVVIDNFPDLRENDESLVENTLIPLVRRALPSGISFALSANLPSNLPGRLLNLFGIRPSLRQTNLDQYKEIVGGSVIDFGNIPGRGYLRSESGPLLFQAALPAGHPANSNEVIDLSDTNDELAQIIGHMKKRWQASGVDEMMAPNPILTLPEEILLRELLEDLPLLPSVAGAVIGTNMLLETTVIDLRDLGPHFAIVGPPRSGKTTAIYNMILSLAGRNSPDDVGMILIDTERRFVEYGGVHSFADLPHVLLVVNEFDQIESLQALLRATANQLRETDNNKDLFVFIDNYDDFEKELGTKQDQTDLASLARRYGRDGLHFVIAGLMDDTPQDLRRRVLASGFGLGLRSASALNPLRVMRIPSELHARELNPGRGYLVQAGRPTLLQVATPYSVEADDDRRSGEETRSSQIETLDKWLDEIMQRYPTRSEQWITTEQEPQSDGSDLSTLSDTEISKLIGILHRIEYQRSDNVEQIADWNQEDLLLAIVKDALSSAVRDGFLQREIFSEIALSTLADSASLIDYMDKQLPMIDDKEPDPNGAE